MPSYNSICRHLTACSRKNMCYSVPLFWNILNINFDILPSFQDQTHTKKRPVTSAWNSKIWTKGKTRKKFTRTLHAQLIQTTSSSSSTLWQTLSSKIILKIAASFKWETSLLTCEDEIRHLSSRTIEKVNYVSFPFI